jgi:hypothetical protein
LQSAILQDREARNRDLYNVTQAVDARARADRSEAFQREQYDWKLKSQGEADARYDTAYADNRTDVANNLALAKVQTENNRVYQANQTNVKDAATQAREDAANSKEALSQAHGLAESGLLDSKVFVGKIPDLVLAGLGQRNAEVRARDIDQLSKSRKYADILNQHKVASGAVRVIKANQKVGDLNTSSQFSIYPWFKKTNPDVGQQEDRTLHMALSKKAALDSHVQEIKNDKRAMQYVMPDENGNYVPSVSPPLWMQQQVKAGGDAMLAAVKRGEVNTLEAAWKFVPPGGKEMGVTDDILMKHVKESQSISGETTSGQVMVQLSDGRKGYATPEAADAILQRDPQAVIFRAPSYMQQRDAMVSPRAYRSGY